MSGPGPPTPENTSELAAAATSQPGWIAALFRIMSSRVFRIGFLVVVLALLVTALVDQGGKLWDQVQKLSLPVLLLAFAAQLGGLIGSLMTWRELLADLGSRLSIADAWRINFIGQLAKYIPGSIWPVVAQTELGADRGIPRGQSAVSVLLSYAVVTVSGALVAVATLPFAEGATLAHYFWVLFVIPIGVLLLSPPVMNRILRFLLRVLRRQPLERGMSVRGLLRAGAWALLMWLSNGAMTYVLVRQLGDHHADTFLIAVGAYALAWVVGFVAIFAPAGAGVREAIMVAALTNRTTSSVALTVALVTRGLSVVGDALTGAVAAALVGHSRLKRLRSGRHDDESPAATV